MSQDLADLLIYFEDTWIGTPFRRAGRNPLFQPTLWSVYDRLQYKHCRTNNSLEGWHRATQMSTGYHHPTIYKLINILRLEESHIENKIVRLNTDHNDSTKHSRYIRTNKTIVKFVQDYRNRNCIDDFRALDYHINLQK